MYTPWNLTLSKCTTTYTHPFWFDLVCTRTSRQVERTLKNTHEQTTSEGEKQNSNISSSTENATIIKNRETTNMYKNKERA